MFWIIYFFFYSELKPQYAEQQPVTNMNELPHLLQTILHRKPNVFKTGGQQYQQQRTRKYQSNIENTINPFLSQCHLHLCV